MISAILECPGCSSRFRFENESNEFPEKISCPQCGLSKENWNFMAVLFCSKCRTKLKTPLSVIHDTTLGCPKCNAPLDSNYHTAASEEIPAAETGSRRQMMLGGEIFDKYRIIRLLGKGGMAEVYLAEHLLLKQQCALKIMLDSTAAKDPVYVKRFLREARLAHRINHPNIIKMYEAGSDAKTGYFFIAMEYVDGQTLTEIMNEHQLSEEYLKILLHSMAGALKCLSDAGVVHRDIKPSNIMLDNNGIFKLMDLGIAKAESNRQMGEMTLTMEQTAIGTPSYASPEQCRSSHDVDTRSDIYSLGATLYHAASGKLPFDGTSPVEIILKVIQSSPEPLNTLRPDLSRHFIALVEMMMKKDPDERPSEPEELMAMLPLSGEAPEIIKKPKMLHPPSEKKKKKSSGMTFDKLLKYGFALLLLLVIAVNFRYINDYYKNGPSQKKDEPQRKAFPAPAVPRKTPRRVVLPTPQKKEEADNSKPVISSPVKPAVQAATAEKTPAPKPVIPPPPVPAANSDKNATAPLSWTREIPELNLCKTPNPYTKDETIDEQVEKARIRYHEFRSETRKLINNQHEKLTKLNFRQRGLYRELLQCRQNLERQWDGHLTHLSRLCNKIRSARNSRYDKRANEKVQQAFLEHTKKRTDWGYNPTDIEFSRKLQRMLENPAVDPNIEVVDGTYNKFNGNLLFSITSGRIQEADKIIKVLCERGADPSTLNNCRCNISYILPMISSYGILPQKRLQEAFDYVFNYNRSRREEYIRLMFMTGAKPHADHLSTAVLEKNRTLVMLLLATGLDPNERDSNGETALFKSYRITDGEDIRELLLAAGADPSIRNKDGRVAADYAVLEKFFRNWLSRNYSECETMLKEGFNPDIRVNAKDTLLIMAVYRLDDRAIKIALKYGADPNRQSRIQTVPLSLAIEALFRDSSRLKNDIENKIRVVKDLVTAGAALPKSNNRYGVLNSTFRYLTLLYDRTESEMIPELAALIVENEKNMQSREFRYIFQSMAWVNTNRKNGPEKIAKAIIKVMPEDLIHSQAFLDDAFRYGYPLKAEKLRNTITSRMINTRYYVRSKGESYPLLFLAVEHGQSPEVIKLLLEKGADPDWKNRSGKKAIDVAKSSEVRRILRKYMK